jgi:hypothetical protein|tara:strand:- start:305 stop:832 length:528 start_codon:yes stop_codon:yes gene_type:complete
MSCDITLGRLEPCKDSVGGIIAIYISNYTSGLLDTATFVDEEVTGFASPLTFYKYDLKGANSFEQTNENSRDNGTSFWTQTGTIVLKKQDLATRKEMKLLSYGRPQIIVQDYNGKYYLAGIENGCEVAANTATGATMGDLNGYNITFTGTEKTPANFVAFAAMVTSADIVVVSGV